MARRVPPPASFQAALLTLFLANPTVAAGPTGRVVSVHDGDTLTVVVDQRQVRVRLIEIDAPELGQPFGARSRQSLAEMCFGRTAELVTRSSDRYGRALATVTCAGRNANAEQVRRGYAWTFTRYADPGSPLHALEGEARAARRGLWSDPAPVPPWDWRRNARQTPQEGAQPTGASPPAH